MLTRLAKVYSNVETLRIATSGSCELFALSGERNPYKEAKLGGGNTASSGLSGDQRSNRKFRPRLVLLRGSNEASLLVGESPSAFE